MNIPYIYYEISEPYIDDVCYMVDDDSKIFDFKLKDFIVDSNLLDFIQFLDKFIVNNYNVTIYEKQYGYSGAVCSRSVNLPRLIIKEYKNNLSNEKLLYLKLL